MRGGSNGALSYSELVGGRHRKSRRKSAGKRKSMKRMSGGVRKSRRRR
jgi:hypothetical protein